MSREETIRDNRRWMMAKDGETAVCVCDVQDGNMAPHMKRRGRQKEGSGGDVRTERQRNEWNATGTDGQTGKEDRRASVSSRDPT